MKKILLILVVLALGYFPISLGKAMNVGPEIWITGKVKKLMSDEISSRITFHSNDDVEGKISGQLSGSDNFLIRIMKWNSAVINLELSRFIQNLPPAPQCQLTVSLKYYPLAQISVKTLPNAQISCTMTGDPNNNTALLTLVDLSKK